MLRHSRFTAGPRCTVCGKAVAFLGPEQPERAWAQRWVRARAKRRGGDGGGNWSRGRRPLLVEVDPYGSDIWRLDPIIQLLQEGALGIIPTDTFPALVCDVDARQAVERLYAAKDMAPTKQLSIMCRSFADVAEYTLGFPAPQPGSPDAFRLARQALPGPYTLILHASKRLPKQCVDYLTGKAKQRRTVGVRLPGDPICQAVLAGLERPLLCSSVHVEAGAGALELPEAAVMLDMFEPRGIDFVVDAGVTVAEGSTIIDLTGREPELLRAGKGDAGIFLPDPVYA